MPERPRWRSVIPVSRDAEDLNRRLLRARHAVDRAYVDMGLRDLFGNAIRVLQPKTAAAATA
jgi:hypothetical protein